jgi:hypothetical protein
LSYYLKKLKFDFIFFFQLYIHTKKNPEMTTTFSSP